MVFVKNIRKPEPSTVLVQPSIRLALPLTLTKLYACAISLLSPSTQE